VLVERVILYDVLKACGVREMERSVTLVIIGGEEWKALARIWWNSKETGCCCWPLGLPGGRTLFGPGV